MTIADQIYFCFKCGEVSPEFTVQGYRRVCTCGSPTVLKLTEAIDYLNQRYEYFNDNPVSEDYIDEEFNLSDLNFEEYPTEIEEEDEPD